MADDVTPSEVRARRFEITRRGYDRSQVDAYLQSLAEEIERLRSRFEDRKTKELKVGLDDPEALALELGTIGGEIATILEAARAAADGMRRRAAEDVDEWRTTTERETSTLAADASEQSQSMRAAAWNEGTSMLSSSLAEAKALVESAREDALFIRAEAEREAIRLTGDARRDRDELIRGARLESEELIQGARNESDGMLAAANQQAEQAQERARALEDRRSELLAELESTRASISHLEEEIDSRRQELETPEPVEEPASDPRTHHTTDGGSVRIVAPSKSVKLKPVDAEDLVADVVALRAGAAAQPPATAAEPEPVEPETVTVIAPPPVEKKRDERQKTKDERQKTKEEAEPEPEPESVAEPEPEPGPDEIGSLFASLRDQQTPDAREQIPDTRSQKPDEEPASVEPEVAEEPMAAEGPEVAEDEETSNAELIPLQNAALKDIKRALVDIQNDALENLRTDTAWEPTKTFTNRFKAPFGELAKAITGSKDDQGASKEFSADLHEAVSGALTKARESGAGDRQVASSVSRVFRMWRADESERRVIDAAQSLHQSTR